MGDEALDRCRLHAGSVGPPPTQIDAGGGEFGWMGDRAQKGRGETGGGMRFPEMGVHEGM